MDYLAQGELLKVLTAYKKMPSQLARFYTAQVIQVFEYFHFKDLIYRDLKPENVLV
jgi:serine/threonine protein kinase